MTCSGIVYNPWEPFHTCVCINGFVVAIPKPYELTTASKSHAIHELHRVTHFFFRWKDPRVFFGGMFFFGGVGIIWCKDCIACITFFLDLLSHHTYIDSYLFFEQPIEGDACWLCLCSSSEVHFRVTLAQDQGRSAGNLCLFRMTLFGINKKIEYLAILYITRSSWLCVYCLWLPIGG